ncbi:MAG: alkaline phosphatase family protein [Planctomycetes bacterium]|nr:alkaline phosphatase family protein [Planctomycetota bacterium]
MIKNKVVVLCCVGLCREQLGEHTPHLNALVQDGFAEPMQGTLPAVTCSAQTSMLTGVEPSQHGIVGNGWYFRDQGEVWLWRQSEKLIQAPMIWDTIRSSGQTLKVHKHFWWYAMNSSCDSSCTPRPAYHADGAKSPDIYTWPQALKHQLIDHHGEFPLFKFWGPLSNIVSTQWIADSFNSAWDNTQPDLGLCYLPHLDYDLQRFGPQGPHMAQNLKDLDAAVGTVLDHVRAQGARCIVVSEYAIDSVHSGVAINQALREHGLLAVTENACGELLDPGMSQAFAVCDHQIAHVYCNDEDAQKRALEIINKLPGVDRCYSGDQRAELGLDHQRSGEIIVIAAEGYWFQYEYWLEDKKKPDFAHSIEIHKKPGYDPRELFFDPKGGKTRAMKAMLRKKLGLRYVMNPIGLDPSLVKGSHGRASNNPERAPLLICDNADFAQDTWHQCDVAALIQKSLLGN